MAITLVAHTGQQTPNGNGFTTTAIDTSGATLLVVAVPSLFGATTSLSDSKSNSWTALTVQNAGGAVQQCWYAYDTSKVGASHTFTISAANTFSSVFVAAFSGTLTGSDPLDAQNGNNA